MEYIYNIKNRKSGIELLKIFAIIFIIISHITASVSSNTYALNADSYCYINLINSTKNIQYIILAMFRNFGTLGNDIFFVCSAWFLLDNDNIKIKKILKMIIQVWVISVITMIIFLILGFKISPKEVLFSMFPNTFANNWYITCYLLLYIIHSKLNMIIKSMTKQQHLTTCTIMIILYMIFGYIKNDLFFGSSLILFITMYFCVAYMKMYLKNIVENNKNNIIAILVGIMFYVFLVIATNFLGLNIKFFNNKLMFWNSRHSPFMFIISLGLFNIFYGLKFESKIINKISSLSLLIYIIHENILFRQYIRPIPFYYIYNNFGYSRIILWILLYSVILFFISLLISVIFKKFFDKILNKLSEKLTNVIYKVYHKLY